MDLRTFVRPDRPRFVPLPEIGERAPDLPGAPAALGRPRIVAFLRHVGCPFAELTMKTLDQASALELTQGAQNVKLQASSGGGQVQAFPQAHERHTAVMKLLDGRYDVRQAAPEAVERPDRNQVDAPASRIRHEAIEGGAAIMGT